MSCNHLAIALPVQSLHRKIVALTGLLLLLGCASAQNSPSRISSSSTNSATAAWVNTQAVISAVGRAAVAAISINGSSTAGTFPIFADASGNLTDSGMVQAGGNIGIASGNLGVGTTTPSTLIHMLGVNPTMRIEQYGPVGSGYSPNFNFYTGNGTAAAPTATQDGDNLGQFAASGFMGLPAGFPASSKVKVQFIAVGNWTTTANGTAMSFQTTSSADAMATRTSRMYIDNTGNVGIGSIYGPISHSLTPPPYPLSVAGVIQSTTGGFKFPDGTTQTTAQLVGPPGAMGETGAKGATGPQGPAGAAVASPNGSILVGGTPSAQTVEVNTVAIQQRVTGTCATGQAVASVNENGTVSCVATGTVTDAKGNSLGRLLSMNGTDLTIYDKGYIITVGITGEFPVGYTQASTPWPQQLLDLPSRTQQGILWTGTACNGTSYLDAGYSGEIFGSKFPTIYTKTVVYSAQANALMVPSGTGDVATAVNIDDGSEEFAGYYSGTQSYVYADGVSFCNEFGRTEPGWPLVAIDPATTLGWTVSGSPLSIAGPLQLP